MCIFLGLCVYTMRSKKKKKNMTHIMTAIYNTIYMFTVVGV